MTHAQLPAGLVKILRYVDEVAADTGELTLGAVTFRSVGDVAAEELSETLAADRWTSMPPSMLPFAVDAVGNRFCIVMDEDIDDPERLPVIYWMYETALAVPIASCFERFLDWVGLVSEIHVRRGADEAYARAHHEEVVQPTLKALGVERDFFALTTSPFSPVGSLHLGMMRVDPEAPGSRVVAAHRASIDNRQKDAILHARAALDSFPGFLSALWFLVNFENAPIRVIGYKDLVRRLARMPLVYRGDPMMAEFVDIPSPRLYEISKRISSVATSLDAAEDPVVELLMWDDVYEPTSWLRAALELANAEQYACAHTAAINAAYVATDKDVLRDIWMFQEELYGEMQWKWHANMVQKQLANYDDLTDLHKKIF